MKTPGQSKLCPLCEGAAIGSLGPCMACGGSGKSSPEAVAHVKSIADGLWRFARAVEAEKLAKLQTAQSVSNKAA